MKTVIVIGGGNTGYSEEITKTLITEGKSVIATFNSENIENAEQLKQSNLSNLKLTKLDLSSRSDIMQFASNIDTKIDGLVFAEFYFFMEDPNNFDFDKWDKSVAINLTAPNTLIHTLKSKMKDGSSNVLITSTEGFRGSYGASSYSATKAAIHNLVKSLANNLGKRGIRVNALPAGWIGGEMDTDEIFNKSRELTPIGRLGRAQEVASVVSFLLSDKSTFINGTTVVTDGGYLCSDPLSKYEFEN